MTMAVSSKSKKCHSDVPMLLLLLVVRGFWGMVGRAASAGFAPSGTGGFGLTGPPGELDDDVDLRRRAGSGLASPRGGVFSGEPGSDLLTELVGDLLSEMVGWDLPAEIFKKSRLHPKIMYERSKT